MMDVNESDRVLVAECQFPEVREVQLALLRILKNVDAICRRHAILYWLDGGTLLGAVRHKGFIPWDDDVDIVMPREDYERFVEVAQSELQPDLFLQTRLTDPGYAIYQVPCKIRELASVELEALSDEEGAEWGIYLDIIPIDKYRKFGFGRFVDYSAKYLYRRLCGINASKRADGKGIRQRLNNFFARVKHLIFSDILVEAYRKKLQGKINRSKRLESGYRLGYAFDSLWMRFFDPKDIFPLREMLFEDGSFPAPANCAAVLRVFYGSNYMTLPEESQRLPRKVKLARDIALLREAGVDPRTGQSGANRPRRRKRSA